MLAVIGAAGDGQEAQTVVAELDPDVVQFPPPVGRRLTYRDVGAAMVEVTGTATGNRLTRRIAAGLDAAGWPAVSRPWHRPSEPDPEAHHGL